MDCRCPAEQPAVSGVERLQVVDVPQQVGPTALLGAIAMTVGGVEAADQYPAKGLPQGLVHHLLVAASAEKVPLGGSRKGPDVAVDPVLTPAGLIGVDHRAGSDALPDLGHCRLDFLGHLPDDLDDGAQAQGQVMHRLQVLLDGTGWYWMVLDGTQGSRPSSRRAAIRLSRLIPNRGFPRTTPVRSA